MLSLSSRRFHLWSSHGGGLVVWLSGCLVAPQEDGVSMPRSSIATEQGLVQPTQARMDFLGM